MKFDKNGLTILFFWAIVVCFLLRFLLSSMDFSSGRVKGPGFSVEAPEGWKKGENEEDMFSISDEKPEIVTFTKTNNILNTNNPDATISIFSQKITTPLWIEDEFPNILQSLAENSFTVLNRGQIKIDDKVNYWALYEDNQETYLNFEFYYFTDSQIFVKIKYKAKQAYFDEYRPDFEKMKDTFKYRFGIL